MEPFTTHSAPVREYLYCISVSFNLINTVIDLRFIRSPRFCSSQNSLSKVVGTAVVYCVYVFRNIKELLPAFFVYHRDMYIKDVKVIFNMVLKLIFNAII